MIMIRFAMSRAVDESRGPTHVGPERQHEQLGCHSFIHDSVLASARDRARPMRRANIYARCMPASSVVYVLHT
jgi:hypothetical protein